MNQLSTMQDIRLARAIDSALTGLASSTQAVYRHRLALFFAQPHKTGFTRESVQSYIRGMKEASVVNQTLSALKRLANEAAEAGWLAWPEAIAIARIKGKKVTGVRTGRWLTIAQVGSMINSCDSSSLPGKRDAALLALLFGCGLRRAEVCSLETKHLENGTIKNLSGKGGRLRTLTIPQWAAKPLSAWLEASEVTGPIIRSFHADGSLNGSLTPDGVYKILAGYASRIGVKCAPHDARRSCARLARDGGASLESIQKTLGHSNQVTTERYISSTEAANAGDFIELD
jgi:integrase